LLLLVASCYLYPSQPSRSICLCIHGATDACDKGEWTRRLFQSPHQTRLIPSHLVTSLLTLIRLIHMHV
jgi:hypothetical protein